jgi:hypothetical protein
VITVPNRTSVNCLDPGLWCINLSEGVPSLALPLGDEGREGQGKGEKKWEEVGGEREGKLEGKGKG